MFGRCVGCEARQETIDILRQQLNLVTDRLMILSGKPEATTESLTATAEPAKPEGEREVLQDEPDELTTERLADEAAREIEEWERTHQVPVGATRDA